jgi:hypothetical protein
MLASQSIRNTCVEKRVGLPYTLILLNGPLLMRASDRLKPETSLFLHRVAKVGLVVAAIILWNTIYLERAIGTLRQQGRQVDESLIKHVAPVHWNHINLTGDYSWRQNKRVEKGGFRPLRISAEP